MLPSNLDERLGFTVSEAAELLGVSSVTVYRAVESGRLPCRRIMTRILIPKQVIQEFGKTPAEA